MTHHVGGIRAPGGPTMTNRQRMNAGDLLSLPAVVDLLTAAAIGVGRTVTG
jgi:hypothetical protein